MNKQYRFLALGGTFDHFHAGHKKFIKFTSELAETLIVGITDTSMLQTNKNWSHAIQTLAERTLSVRQYCHQLQQQCEIIVLTDVVGSTITDSRIEALAVTSETLPGGQLINQIRHQRGLPALPLHTCQLFLAEDQRPLHADRIRAGECNSFGRYYLNTFNQVIQLNNRQRICLQQPLGKLMSNTSLSVSLDQPPIILVGDSTTDYFINQKLPFHLAIFDRKIQRQDSKGHTQQIKTNHVVDNPAGTIQPKLATTISQCLQLLSQQEVTRNNSKKSPQPQYIYVQGEEDLAAVPAILLAPLGATVFYGQPKQGLVKVDVTEQLKQFLLEIIDNKK